MANLLSAVIAVAEADHAVVDGFEPAVGDGDAEDIAAEVVEHLIAAAGMLGMNDPAFLPHGDGRSREQARLFKTGTEFRAEDDRQGTDREPGRRMFGIDPGMGRRGRDRRR